MLILSLNFGRLFLRGGWIPMEGNGTFRKTHQGYGATVKNGPEIRQKSPVEVGSEYPIIYGVFDIPTGCLEVLNHQQKKTSEVSSGGA